jgi:sorbitol/mannitol transport system substrate-binding protein
LDDVLKPMRDALSYDNNLYALPFYGESSIIYYRTDLFEKAGLKMPEQPTWDDIAKFAKKLNDPTKGVTGILLRGMPGWGEILAPLDTVINTFGGQWYDQNWNAQFDKPETKKAVAFYTDLLKTAGEKGATTSGFTELETAMAQGKAAMWYDASVAAGFLNDPKQSQVVGKIGYAKAPVEVTPNGSGWLWAWSLALESSSKHKDAAFKFMTWATSKDYIKLVGDTKGWVVAPPGTRKSTYENPEYKKAAPFSDVVLSQIEKANITHPTKDPVPYTGIQYVSIPEFAQLGTNVSQDFSAVIAGQKSVDDALKDAQKQANDIAKQGGYQK